MEKELEHRKKVVRVQIGEKIGAALEFGDLKENAEYHDAKNQQVENETRVSQLEKMLKEIVLIEEGSAQQNDQTIRLGRTFKVNVDGREKTFQIVGSAEASPLMGKISNESPLGMAFLGRTVGEDVEVDLPSGKKVFHILELI